MARDLRHLMRHTATVLRLTRVPVGYGEWHEVHAETGTLLCRVSEPDLIQRTDQQGRLRADSARFLYTLPGEDIQTGDRVRIDALGLVANVEAAADQSEGAYRKALIVEE